MRRIQISTFFSLLVAVGTACPSSGNGGSGGDTDADDSSSSGSGEAPVSESTTAQTGTSTTTQPPTTSGPDGASSGSSTGAVPDGDAACPNYDTLSLDELLLAGPGGARIDSVDAPIVDVEFGDFDGVTAIVGVLGDDAAIVLPLDEAAEGPSGQVLLVEGDDVFEGQGDLLYDQTTDAISLTTTTLALSGGRGTRDVSMCFYIGAGSSSFEIDGSVATIRGALGSLTYTQIQRIQEERPEVSALVLADVPGSINDEVNVETGRLVRNAGWSTHIPAGGEIASGGVDLFCAGAQRSLDEGARIGVHSWSDGQMDGADYPPESPEHVFFLEYLTEMLGDPTGPDFYWFTLEAAPAADIHWMSSQEIAEYQLLTR